VGERHVELEGMRGNMAAVEGFLEEMIRSEVVDAPDVARVLGTSTRSVSRWMSAGAVPRRETEERLLELKAVVDLLRDVLRDEPARLWLRSPNPTLDYHKPIDLVERGEYRRVIGAILALAEGVTA
jgi:putative toxin-antitoxin system antitoxin component (TIGR02293 family)